MIITVSKDPVGGVMILMVGKVMGMIGKVMMMIVVVVERRVKAS